MFQFKIEPDIPLLTVTRTGLWSLSTVVSYEVAVRRELALLKRASRPTAFIIDIRASGPQPSDVAEALRAMVRRLGHLRPDRVAVVTSSGLAKLQARRVTDDDAQVFTSMVLARDWVTRADDPAAAAETVHDAPSDAEAEGPMVHVHGPSDVDVTFTAAAALETAKRIADAATEALLVAATSAPRQSGHPGGRPSSSSDRGAT